MIRRFLAGAAIVALSVAFLSADAVLLAGKTSDCCANGMCPMLHMATQASLQPSHSVDCDMDLNHPAAQLQSCPASNLRYVAALIFVRVAPPTLVAGERPMEWLLFSASLQSPKADLDVVVPPPRLTLA